MKIFTSFIALTFAILAFSFGNVNAQSFSDAKSARTVGQNVERQILRLPRYEVFDHISYSINDGTVTLSGKVRNAVNKDDAKRRVEDIPGVKQVINNIEILPVGSFDEGIRQNLYRTLSNTANLSRYLWPLNPSVRLIVERGNITLEGYVSNKSDSDLMNVVAHSIPGSFSVTNNLVVDSGKAR